MHPMVKGFLYFIDVTDGAGLNEDNQCNLVGSLQGADWHRRAEKCDLFLSRRSGPKRMTPHRTIKKSITESGRRRRLKSISLKR